MPRRCCDAAAFTPGVRVWVGRDGGPPRAVAALWRPEGASGAVGGGAAHCGCGGAAGAAAPLLGSARLARDVAGTCMTGATEALDEDVVRVGCTPSIAIKF